MIEWLKQNTGTVGAWIGMLLTLLVSLSVDRALGSAKMASHERAILDLADVNEKQDDDIELLRADVRSITEAQGRLALLVDRTEQTVREIQTLTAELRAVVEVIKNER